MTKNTHDNADNEQGKLILIVDPFWDRLGWLSNSAENTFQFTRIQHLTFNDQHMNQKACILTLSYALFGSVRFCSVL